MYWEKYTYKIKARKRNCAFAGNPNAGTKTPTRGAGKKKAFWRAQTTALVRVQQLALWANARPLSTLSTSHAIIFPSKSSPTGSSLPPLPHQYGATTINRFFVHYYMSRKTKTPLVHRTNNHSPFPRLSPPSLRPSLSLSPPLTFPVSPRLLSSIPPLARLDRKC